MLKVKFLCAGASHDMGARLSNWQNIGQNIGQFKLYAPGGRNVRRNIVHLAQIEYIADRLFT